MGFACTKTHKVRNSSNSRRGFKCQAAWKWPMSLAVILGKSLGAHESWSLGKDLAWIPSFSRRRRRGFAVIDSSTWKACPHLNLTSSQTHKDLSLSLSLVEDALPHVDCIILLRNESLHLCMSCKAPPGWRQKSYSLNG